MSGLIDRTYPLFNAIDQALAPILPAWARLVFYGVISAAITMAVYLLVSRQDAIRSEQVRMKDLQGQLKRAQDDIGLTMRLTRANLASSMRLLGLSLWPAIVASLPVIAILAWLTTAWSQPMPVPGVLVPVSFGSGGAVVEPPEALTQEAGGPALRWPTPEAPVRFLDERGPVYEGLGTKPPAASITKERWWNWLLGNPAGYLRQDGSLDQLSLTLPEREVLSFGPGWMRGFAFTYFVAVVVVSLLIKRIFKIA